jgi:hypothetical protein
MDRDVVHTFTIFETLAINLRVPQRLYDFLLARIKAVDGVAEGLEYVDADG